VFGLGHPDDVHLRGHDSLTVPLAGPFLLGDLRQGVPGFNLAFDIHGVDFRLIDGGQGPLCRNPGATTLALPEDLEHSPRAQRPGLVRHNPTFAGGHEDEAQISQRGAAASPRPDQWRHSPRAPLRIGMGWIRRWWG